MSQHFRYFFSKGFYKVPYGRICDIRKDLTEVLCAGARTNFYRFLRNGIRDISVDKHQQVTAIFASYGIPEDEIWEKREDTQ